VLKKLKLQVAQKDLRGAALTLNDLNCSCSSRLGCNPRVIVKIFEAPEQPNHNRLLHMEPVFSLIEGNALGSFQHFVGYLLSPDRGGLGDSA